MFNLLTHVPFVRSTLQGGGFRGGFNTMKKKKDVWKFVIQTVIAILTAIGTTLGVTSCMV